MRNVCLFAALFLTWMTASFSGADEILQNGDFSDGTTFWHGNAKPAASATSTDLITGGGGSAGVVVELHPTTWTEIKQEIKGLKRDMTAPNLALKITYQVSPEFSLSDRPEDYKGDDPQTGLGVTLGFETAHIVGRLGQLLVFIDAAPINREVATNGTLYFVQDTLSMGSFKPVAGSAQTFTATLRLPHLTGGKDASFCVAIPPGHGTITFTQISLAR